MRIFYQPFTVLICVYTTSLALAGMFAWQLLYSDSFRVKAIINPKNLELKISKSGLLCPAILQIILPVLVPLFAPFYTFGQQVFNLSVYRSKIVCCPGCQFLPKGG
jgi:hypothetical protein